LPAETSDTRYVGFVRNVMIGREGLHRSVLVEIFHTAGATDARSYISTGNVSFSARPRTLAAIISGVEERIAEVIGRPEPVFVRSVDYLSKLVASEPFSSPPFPDPVERTVSFAHTPIEPGAVDLPIWSRRGDVALFGVTAGEVFAVGRLIDRTVNGGGGLVERTIGQAVTTRSWNTVLRVVADSGP
jgi:uncharacterized protein (DUF1697 family)